MQNITPYNVICELTGSVNTSVNKCSEMLERVGLTCSFFINDEWVEMKNIDADKMEMVTSAMVQKINSIATIFLYPQNEDTAFDVAATCRDLATP